MTPAPPATWLEQWAYERPGLTSDERAYIMEHVRELEALRRTKEAAVHLRDGIRTTNEQQFEVVGDHFALRCWDLDHALTQAKEARVGDI